MKAHLLASVVLLLTACGSSSSPSAPGGDAAGGSDGTGVGPTSGPGTGSLAGPQGFPVKWAWMDPSEPSDECGADAVPGGGYAATAIDLFEDDESSQACSDAGFQNGAGMGHVVSIEIATTAYAAGATTFTQALAPGTYVIGNEGENDEDLCMLPAGATAILQVLDFGQDDAQAIAISGTVTIESVSAKEIKGSFSVLLGGPYGGTDGGPPEMLSGAFDAATCP